MKVLSFNNQKGGVAKTTMSVHTAKMLNDRGIKTLLIDFDPQSNATKGSGIKRKEIKHSIADLCLNYYDSDYNTIKIEDAIHYSTEGIYVIPATVDLAILETKPAKMREKFLYRVIKEIKEKTDFKYIIIDSPPTLGFFNDNVLMVAEDIYIPVQAEPYAIEGIGALIKAVNIAKKDMNEKIKIKGVILTMVDLRTKTYKEVKEALEKYFPNELFDTLIKRNVRISDAPGEYKTIFNYETNNSSSRNAIDNFNEYIEEFLKKEDFK